MKLGILCYASPTGLGYQTRDYVKYLNPDKLLAVDLSMYNGMPVYKEWYEGRNVIWTSGVPNNDEINRFLDGLDVVFMAETPLNYYLFEEAKRRGIKTFNAFNYEFLDYFKHPEWEVPTVLAAPTVWNIDIVRGLNKTKVHHFPVPVERNHPVREINELKKVFHIIGRPAVNDRNGTLSFLSAIERIGRKYEYIVYLQEPTDFRAKEYYEPVRKRLMEVKESVGIKIVKNSVDNKELFSEGDLLILPRRYGGLCLPMQEALSWGIPVIMTDISPNDSVLPKNWLVKAVQKTMFRGHAEIPVYEADIDDLVVKIGQFADGNFMKESNHIADGIGESLSWENLKPKYLQWFAEL